MGRQFVNVIRTNRAQIAFALALQVLSIPIMLVLMMRARESNYSEEGMLLSSYQIVLEIVSKLCANAIFTVDVIVPHYAEKIATKPKVNEVI